LKLDAYAGFAEAVIVEAEALAGDARRALELAQPALAAADRWRPLLERVRGIALARLGRPQEARTALKSALDSARERCSEYDVAATIDVLLTVDSVDPDPELVRTRDEILNRLKIVRLPVPAV
jgi:hypothetical protein